MKRTTLNLMVLATVTAMVMGVGTMSIAHAHGSNVVVAGQADVRVWVDGGDVFPGYADVSVFLRADRDCYATLLLVDTAGYVHVLYPSSPYERAWLHGGRTYRYDACDIGLDRLDGVGISHIFAVGSPVPFDYTAYGASIFVGGFGFRVYGDPYIACRDFYVSLLPASCRWDYVGVSSARFYVRQWVRYPSYLCRAGVGVHVRIGDNCRECVSVYASYRHNAASPYDVLRPAKFKQTYSSTSVAGGRVERTAKVRVNADLAARSAKSASRTVVKQGDTRAVPARARVVSTSRGAQQRSTPVVTKSKARVETSRPSKASGKSDSAVASRDGSSANNASKATAKKSNAASQKAQKGQKKGAAKKAGQAR
jgi:hypothetical protein